MKRLLLLIVIVSSFIQIGCSKIDDIPDIKEEEYKNALNVMTFNIRYSPNDGINNWEYRREMATNVFLDYSIDIAGLQEVVDVQFADLNSILTDYTIFGEDSGVGVYSPIVYKKDKFDLLDSGNFWLSDNPEVVGSIGWDSKYPRIVTWGKFKCKDTNSIFFFFNTHFDHVGNIAKRESAKLLMTKLAEVAGSFPAIISGDFNFTKDDSYYDIITGKNNTVNVKDSKTDTEIPYNGIESSFNGFGNSKMLIIDFLFVTENIKTKMYNILIIRDGDVYISDHYPVYSSIAF